MTNELGTFVASGGRGGEADIFYLYYYLSMDSMYFYILAFRKTLEYFAKLMKI